MQINFAGTRTPVVLFCIVVPRFYLSLRDGEFLRDDEGQEFADLDAARDTALRGAREMMAEDIKRGVLSLNDSVEITDESGQRVATIMFRDAIQIDG